MCSVQSRSGLTGKPITSWPTEQELVQLSTSLRWHKRGTDVIRTFNIDPFVYVVVFCHWTHAGSRNCGPAASEPRRKGKTRRLTDALPARSQWRPGYMLI